MFNGDSISSHQVYVLLSAKKKTVEIEKTRRPFSPRSTVRLSTDVSGKGGGRGEYPCRMGELGGPQVNTFEQIHVYLLEDLPSRVQTNKITDRQD